MTGAKVVEQEIAISCLAGRWINIRRLESIYDILREELEKGRKRPVQGQTPSSPSRERIGIALVDAEGDIGVGLTERLGKDKPNNACADDENVRGFLFLGCNG